MPFAVLNPGGRDAYQTFPSAAGSPNDPGHAPINYHAYAACLRGAFARDVREIPPTVSAVLVLLRRNGLDAALEAVNALRERNVRTLVSWKESGLHQVSDALNDAKRYAKFAEICRAADGYLASTPELIALYESAGSRRGEFLPTPYPIEAPAWNFSAPIADRSGIFVGTREFDIPSRNHLLAVATAGRLSQRVTVVNTDGRRGERLLQSISPSLRILSGPLPYPEYLREMARHRIVFQLDRSAVPGQVAGDALLARVICVGGDGAVERMAFPDTSGLGRTPEQLSAIASSLLADEATYRHALTQVESTAARTLSFSAVAEKLQKFLGGL